MAKVTPEYNLAVLHPKVAKQWHPTKNGELIPEKVAAGSHMFAYWICPDCNRTSRQEIRKRVKSNYGCSKCGDKVGRESRKLGIRKMQEIAKEREGECLSEKYVNNLTKLKWKCSEGHTWEATPNNVLSKDSWCGRCAKNIPLTIEEMQEIAEGRGGQCISQSYTNSSTPLIWKCGEGHIWEANPNSIKRGSWCLICSGSAKKTIDDARRLAATKEGECLSEKYVNANTKMEWRCGHGHEWPATFSSIWNLDTWCPRCAGYGKTIDDMRLLAASMGGECLSGEYVSKDVKLIWRCDKSHEWSASPHNVNHGHWCPLCSQGRSERICREHFESIFGVKFPKARPSWLRSPDKGKWMELDGYSIELNMAFEYQGRQHYEPIEHFHGESGFERRQMLDDWKRRLCKEKGVILIEVPYTVNYEDMRQFIIEQSTLIE